MDEDQRRGGGIMVVDDQPENLRLLEEMLRSQGYRVRSLPRGRLALASALLCPPDLVLLDVNMPEMNGYEVCEQMSAREALRGIPVLFLSALNDATSKVRSFQAGAVDYITKPFHVDEVRARVRTHLDLHRLKRELLAQNDRLERLVADRTRELSEANARLRILDQAKTDFLALISHELRTPLNGILGVGELLLDDRDAHAADDDGLRDLFDQSRRRMLSLLDDALFLTRIELETDGLAPRLLALPPLLGAALAQAGDLARSRDVSFALTPGAASVLGTEKLLEKALAALVQTAVRLSLPGETVRVGCEPAPGAVRVAIESRGRAVPAPLLPRFFELLSIAEPITSGGDLGLAPYLASRLFALQGGSVSVENCHPAGVRLSASLKAAA